MRTVVVQHPLVEHKLTTLRDVETPSPTFRALTEELVTLLAFEATRGLRTHPVTVTTSEGQTTGEQIARPRPLLVPILRAGLGMLDGMLRLLPSAEVGFLGVVRDEQTLQATTYADRIPADLTGRQAYILDPMLATGGTLAKAIESILSRGAVDVTAIVLIAAPEGLRHLEEAFAGSSAAITVIMAGLDSHLNEHGYIVPGLGDAGDRLYGSV